MTNVPYTPWLTTLTAVRQDRRLTTTQTSDDALIQSYIEEVSGQIQSQMRRVCVPYRMTKTYDADSPFVPVCGLYFEDDDLLEVTTLTNAGTTISSSDYLLQPNNSYPKTDLVLLNGKAFTWNTTPLQAISVAGLWGYVPHYATGAWKTVTTLNGTITDSATSLTATSAASIAVGGYLKLGSETLFVSAVASNVVTVERGVLGTEAAEHTTGATIQQFKVLPDIEKAARDTVVWCYINKDKIGREVVLFQGGQVGVKDLDPSVYKTIERHRKTPWGVAG